MTKEEWTTHLTAARDLEVQRLSGVLFRYAQELPFDAYRREVTRDLMREIEALRDLSIEAMADALMEASK